VGSSTRFPISVIIIAIAVSPAPCQHAEPDCFYCNALVVKFPFALVTDAQRNATKAVELHLSRDEGVTWQHVQTVPADVKWISFTAKSDGAFWFALRTIDKSGNRDPAVLDKSAIQMKVVFDTTPPVVELRAKPGRKDALGVTWKVSDDHLDGASVRLEYRQRDEATWTSVPIDIALRECTVPARPGTGVTVRLTARDLAGNATSKSVVFPATP